MRKNSLALDSARKIQHLAESDSGTPRISVRERSGIERFSKRFIDLSAAILVLVIGLPFLCAIALVPQLVAGALDIDYFIVHFLGGTTILIMVGVALDLVDKIEAQLLVRQYEGFMRGGEGPRRGGGPSTPSA